MFIHKDSHLIAAAESARESVRLSLTAQVAQHYFAVLATDAQQTGQIEGFLARATQALDPALIRVYRSALSGRDRIGIIYGEFPTREAAVSAMLAMPESIKAAQPFPRQVVRLR